MPLRRPAAVLIVLLATAALLELGLRIVGSVGFSFDRWIGACDEGAATTPLNHAPKEGVLRLRLEPAAPYGQFAGLEYEEVIDEHGIKRSALRPQDGEGTRILFMGDSFIQGYDDTNTIPQRAYEWIVAHGSRAGPIIVLNAANTSYSPLIFTVQAKRLLPVLRPDFLVIDIDETDLFDDAVRYRELVVRDGNGKVVAIERNPGRLALAKWCGRALHSPLHLLRLVAAAYYQVRRAQHERRAAGERLFAVAETSEQDIGPELREQMRYFSTTLAELFTTLAEHLPTNRILVVRHPHLGHLQKNQDGRPVMNRAVGEIVRATAARSGITFFDAQDELATRFADHPERYYWNAPDMHLNFDGMRVYGDLVGRELARKLSQGS